jgi:hypothetical protein
LRIVRLEVAKQDDVLRVKRSRDPRYALRKLVDEELRLIQVTARKAVNFS